MKSECSVCAPPTDRDLESEWFQWEHTCKEPKVCDKRLTRAESEEILAEARSDIVVRIVRDTRVLEAKYMLNHPVAGSSEVIIPTAGVEQLIK